MTLLPDEVELIQWNTSEPPLWQPLPGEYHPQGDQSPSRAREDAPDWQIIARDVEAERAWAEIVAEFRLYGIGERSCLAT